MIDTNRDLARDHVSRDPQGDKLIARHPVQDQHPIALIRLFLVSVIG